MYDLFSLVFGVLFHSESMSTFEILYMQVLPSCPWNLVEFAKARLTVCPLAHLLVLVGMIKYPVLHDVTTRPRPLGSSSNR